MMAVLPCWDLNSWPVSEIVSVSDHCAHFLILTSGEISGSRHDILHVSL